MKKDAFQPDPHDASIVFYDVGASGDLQPQWKPFAKRMEIYAFDLSAEKMERYASGDKPHSVTVIPSLLSSRNETRAFHIPMTHSGSSFFELDWDEFWPYFFPAYHSPEEIVHVATRSPADLIQSGESKPPDFIKLDTQGSELEILMGLGDHISGLLGAEVEVEFEPLYKGQPMFCDVHQFMIARGFELLDLRTARFYHTLGKEEDYYVRRYGGRGATSFWSAKLYAGDALYMRKWQRIVDKFEHSVFAKYFLIMLAYKFFDRCYFLLDQVEERRLLSPASVGEYRRHLNAAAHSPFTLRAGLRIVYGLLRRLRIPVFISGNYNVAWTLRRWPDS